MSLPDHLGAPPPMPASAPSFEPTSIPSALPSEIPAPLLPLLAILASSYETFFSLFYRIPGSQILTRYIKSSHQNDPYRSLLELFLFAFAIRTILKGRTRGDAAGKNFIKFTEKEIDELVEEWQPLPLCDDAEGESDEVMLESIPMIQGPNGLRVKLSNGQQGGAAGNGKVVLNLATPDWCGFTENEKMKQVAIDTLKVYGVGSCGPSGFYGTIGGFVVLPCDSTNILLRCPYSARKGSSFFPRHRSSHHLLPILLNSILLHPRIRKTRRYHRCRSRCQLCHTQGFTDLSVHHQILCSWGYEGSGESTGTSGEGSTAERREID
jgi:hypothetical protein